MPDVLGRPPSPRVAVFWNGTAWQWALVDAAGHLQIDVVSLLGLEGALQSVATDRLIVRGEDQLFSIDSRIATRYSSLDHAAGTVILPSTSPGAGEYWIVTSLCAQNSQGPCDRIEVRSRTAAVYHNLNAIVGPAQYVPCIWSGWTPINSDDDLVAVFYGTALDDDCLFDVHGFVMTVET